MINIDVFASLLAGLGLFFVGIKGISANLGQLAGRSLRKWVARSTGNYVLSALIGMLAGALVQSTNAVTVILMSLAKADLITLRQATPILVWSNASGISVRSSSRAWLDRSWPRRREHQAFRAPRFRADG